MLPMESTTLHGAHSRWVHDCCWLAGGRLAVSCGFEGVALVRVVPATTLPDEVGILGDCASSVVQLKHDGRVRACCSLDASCLATASGGIVQCWDVESSSDPDKALRSITLGHMLGEVQTLAKTAGSSVDARAPFFAAGTPPNKQARRAGVTSAGAAGTIAMLDLRSSSGAVGALVGHANTVWQVQCSALHPQLVCSASADGTAKVWDIRTQQVLQSVGGGHRGGIRRCTFVAGAARDQQQGKVTIMTGGFDTTIRVHTLAGGSPGNDLETSRLLARLGGYCFGLDATDSWIVAGVGNPDYSVRLWDKNRSQGLPQDLGHAQTLLGKIFVQRLLD